MILSLQLIRVTSPSSCQALMPVDCCRLFGKGGGLRASFGSSSHWLGLDQEVIAELASMIPSQGLVGSTAEPTSWFQREGDGRIVLEVRWLSDG